MSVNEIFEGIITTSKRICTVSNVISVLKMYLIILNKIKHYFKSKRTTLSEKKQ